jgi:hypothetical protein
MEDNHDDRCTLAVRDCTRRPALGLGP